MDGSNRGGCCDRAMMVCDGETLLPGPRLVPRLSNSIAPCVATVLVPSPWSTLVSRCFAAARWATRAMPACHRDPSAARFVKTVETVVSWMAGLPRASVGTAKHCHGLPVEAPHDEVKDAIRAQCALETSLGHREVREDTYLERWGGELDRHRRRCRLWGCYPPEARASHKACGRGARASKCFRDDKRCGCFTTLATRDNYQKNERNGNVYQRNHAYQSSPGLCRL